MKRALGGGKVHGETGKGGTVRVTSVLGESCLTSFPQGRLRRGLPLNQEGRQGDIVRGDVTVGRRLFSETKKKGDASKKEPTTRGSRPDGSQGKRTSPTGKKV